MGWNSVIFVALAVLYGIYQRWAKVPVPGVTGSCTEAFKQVEDAYRSGFTSGIDRGSSLAIYHKGVLVCDMLGGWADETNQLPWTNETVSIVFSTTKGISAITLALLRDKGLFKYDDLVSKYWPEFAQNGKEKITIAQVISHQGGLAALDDNLTLKDVRENPNKISRAFEKQKPNWEPGTSHGYHALTFGLLIDQLIRRIDQNHRSLDDVFKQEIATPYGIDFHIGLPLEQQWRSARVSHSTGMLNFMKKVTDMKYLTFMVSLMGKGDKHLVRGMNNPEFDFSDDNLLNHPMTRLTPLGSALGSGSAKSIAKLYSLVADLKHNKRPLFSEKTLKELIAPQTGDRPERFFGLPVPFAMGVFTKRIGKGVEFFHPGYGGQQGAGLPELNLGWSYITNYLGHTLNVDNDERIRPIRTALMNTINNLR